MSKYSCWCTTFSTSRPPSSISALILGLDVFFLSTFPKFGEERTWVLQTKTRWKGAVTWRIWVFSSWRSFWLLWLIGNTWKSISSSIDDNRFESDIEKAPGPSKKSSKNDRSSNGSSSSLYLIVKNSTRFVVESGTPKFSSDNMHW